jgi:hypothetical protein
MMAWQDDMVIMVRVLINDLLAPQKKADAYIEQVIVTAGIFVDQETELATEYDFDVSTPDITPDPTDADDNTFIALATLKAACLLNVGDYQKATGCGMRVRDGDSLVDTSVSFKGYKDILELGACAAYEKLKWEVEQLNLLGTGGAIGAVLGPYRAPGDVVPSFDSLAWYFDNISQSITAHRRRR